MYLKFVKTKLWMFECVSMRRNVRKITMCVSDRGRGRGNNSRYNWFKEGHLSEHLIEC